MSAFLASNLPVFYIIGEAVLMFYTPLIGCYRHIQDASAESFLLFPFSLRISHLSLLCLNHFYPPSASQIYPNHPTELMTPTVHTRTRTHTHNVWFLLLG